MKTKNDSDDTSFPTLLDTIYNPRHLLNRRGILIVAKILNKRNGRANAK